MRRSIRAIAAALTVALILPAVVLSAWPVADRHSYISQGSKTGHRADDIAAPAGTEVMPIKSGRVVFAGWKRNCGGYQVWVRFPANTTCCLRLAGILCNRLEASVSKKHGNRLARTARAVREERHVVASSESQTEQDDQHQ